MSLSLSLHSDVEACVPAHRNPTSYKGTKLTALEEIFELVAFRRRREVASGAMSDEGVAELYSSKVKFSTVGDAQDANMPNSSHWISMAMAVYKKVLSISRVRNALVRADSDMESNPLDSVTKLSTLSGRCKTEEMLTWVVEMILDLVHVGAMTYELCTVRALEGHLGSCTLGHLTNEERHRKLVISSLFL